MIGHLSIRELRTQLGWTQEQLAQSLFISSRTISRIENGLVRPHPATQHSLYLLHKKHSPKSLPSNVKTVLLNAASMQKFLGKAIGWQTMTRKQRGLFRRWKLFYKRVLADQSAGRCIIVYRNRK